MCVCLWVDGVGGRSVYHTTLVQKSGHVHPVDQAVLQQSQLISKRVSESKNAVAFSLGPTVALSKRFIAYIKGL
mgnify:FL=1